MDKSGNCMPKGSKTMQSNQLLFGRGADFVEEIMERRADPAEGIVVPRADSAEE